MDLSHPTQDLSNYDSKIEDIERNLRQLEKEYGFSREKVDLTDTRTTPSLATKFTINKASSKGYNYNKTNGIDGEEADQPQTLRPVPTPLVASAKYLNKPQDQPRYKNLIGLDVEKPRMIKNNPEISEKWPMVFANKPDLKMFYAEQEFNPSVFDKQDFQTNINLLNTNAVFTDYMDSFGLQVL